MTVTNWLNGSTTCYTVYTEKYTNLITISDFGTDAAFSMQIYHVDAERYTQLAKEWISWAISNGVSCDGLGDLPGARWYIFSSAIAKWASPQRSMPPQSSSSVAPPDNSADMIPGRDFFPWL